MYKFNPYSYQQLLQISGCDKFVSKQWFIVWHGMLGLVDIGYGTICLGAPMISKESVNLITKSNQAHVIEIRMK